MTISSTRDLPATAQAWFRHRWQFGLLVLVCLSLSAMAHAAQVTARGLLDGTTISAAFVDKAGQKQGDDSLVFTAGALEASGLRKAYAFEPAPYTTEKAKDGTISFKATLTSTEHGSLVIEGTIAKQAITGKRTWSKPGKPPIEQTFTGTLKAEKGAK
jgi:hypothetical protein